MLTHMADSLPPSTQLPSACNPRKLEQVGNSGVTQAPQPHFPNGDAEMGGTTYNSMWRDGAPAHGPCVGSLGHPARRLRVMRGDRTGTPAHQASLQEALSCHHDMPSISPHLLRERPGDSRTDKFRVRCPANGLSALCLQAGRALAWHLGPAGASGRPA